MSDTESTARKTPRLLSLGVLVFLGLRGVMGSVVSWWASSSLGLAWSALIIAIAFAGTVGVYLHHKRTMAISMGGAAYLAGGFAVNALRVGNPPFLWGILMILSLSLLWVYRR